MILDVHLLHCDHLPQQGVLMQCASVLTKTAAMVREQAVNHVEPFLFATPFSLMQAMTSFKLPLPLPLLPQCRQIAGGAEIAPPAERKNSLDGFEGIAFRISQ